MRSLIVLLVITLAVAALARSLSPGPEVYRQFKDFERKYNKHYASPVERTHRANVFGENLKRVEQLNADEGNTVFGVTKFMDLTPAEFKAKYLMKLPPNPELPNAPTVNIKPVDPKAVPNYWAWDVNKTGIVSAVKNQEQCGSCWAFSCTETVESAWALAGHGSVPTLAPQQIVDCDKKDEGCNGGYPWTAYEYIISAGGQEPESDYPYTGVNGACKFKAADVDAKIANWSWVSKSPATEDTTMLTYLYQNGPLSVCVDAASWQFYNGGVLQKNCGDEIDHAVQATGFAVIGGVPAWRVRNSWGADWGENGYIWIKRGINLCDIATKVTVALSA